MDRFREQVNTVFEGNDVVNCLFRSAAEGGLSTVNKHADITSSHTARQVSMMLTHLELARDNLQKAINLS